MDDSNEIKINIEDHLETQYSDSEEDSESERESSHSASSSSTTGSETDSSIRSNDADWAGYIEEDGSLLYVESYMSSTLKERQAHQAIKAASEFSPPAKNLKRHTKLLSLLKRRPSVRVKNSSAITDGSKGGVGSNQEATASPPKVTFRDNPSGEVRHVILRVTEIGNNFGRRATFCEAVLGIMPGRFNEPPDSRVMVAGLAPGSQALKDGSIKIGDWLKEIDGKEVNWSTLDTILMDVLVPSTITLCVQKCAAETLPHDDHINLKRITQTRLVKFLTGKEKKCWDWNSMVERGAMPLHAVLHLSLKGVTEESPEKADIRYQFPSMYNKLMQVRGMFSTLSHSMEEVTGSPILSSTVTLHGVHYHVAFCRDDGETFLIILPHLCVSETDLILLMEQVCKLLRFEFGSMSRGLSDAKNKDYLDHLFLLMLEDILTLEEGFSPSANTVGYVPPFTPLSPMLNYSNVKSRLILSAPSALILRDEYAKVQLESCLNELQSGDFEDNDSDCEDCLLLYNIIGSCIFYKSHLVLSHLDPENTERVFLFADRHRLLQLLEREAVSQLVLWRRVYPSNQPEGDLHPKERKIDHYILFVAMNHFLLATLVESGNVTELMDKDAGPDPFLVDQVETTLYHLHSLHIHSACEESLTSSLIEALTLDTKLDFSPARKTNKVKNASIPEGGNAPPPTRLPDVPSILKQKSSPFDARDSPTCERERSVGEGSDDSFSYPPSPRDTSLPDVEEGEGEGGEDNKEESSSDSDWKIAKGYDGRSSLVNKSESAHSSKGNLPTPIRVTVGDENVLFHIVQLDIAEGVIVTPSYGEDVPPLHIQLLKNFYTAVTHIRHILHIGRRNKTPDGSYCGSNALNSVKEYGIMFECSESSKNKTVVTYWIVGRIYGPPFEREIYVALEDSVPQNMQEIAFKMALGTS